MYEGFADHGERVFVTVQEQGEAVNRWEAEAGSGLAGDQMCEVKPIVT